MFEFGLNRHVSFPGTAGETGPEVYLVRAADNLLINGAEKVSVAPTDALASAGLLGPSSMIGISFKRRARLR
jgi:hypothetical protein